MSERVREEQDDVQDTRGAGSACPSSLLPAAGNEALRPLFIPLKAEYFHEFATGMKDTEYRLYGPRWNERTCQPGRAVTLSLGYGTRNRLSGVIEAFIADPLSCLDGHTMRALIALFGELPWHRRIACIKVRLS